MSSSDTPPSWSLLALPAVGCVTLGLAPFTPEPHLFGKLRWVMGGGIGMGMMDWFDLLLHGFPWVVFLGMAGWIAFTRSRASV